ncbi:2-oxoglutarate dehydrogenase, E2 component, dihydrolipoamide succinyltransferase [Corynebacterium stationis]|uniref:2-oxoglutarate dehydrogenase, E2 component, dihydrolipoamide succinyltransferase n=2 Tax=Corynebacterium stationis TaxID=1705 RepID=UPI00076F913B|nr:2-oxoglutarate dehydrogenase, E2 component, dihydrolipoamide succinyltransferase [Corynebacterium stationis]AMJ44294.1 pyruvate dehydrogenase complex dihydrolipoyllysine-residue acetyltransferase [Corynebacterium stationis]AQX70749.1 pyruvate dehydrogenase complex dihydrolipoyllysine-residue acetyltransferase [Corynebacterium stationis]ASJ18438.1 pyruvate dehydrogenase complex dihydrolipoyllysine-residue acetyltransferase [Corynebacterium stationis]HJG63534.1 2-oxoglutarate dehydrogenase, E2
MAYSVEMPELGESVTEGTITQWLKSVGDTVEADEPLLEVSTDKVDTEIPSPVSGTLLEIKAEEDDTIDVGAVIAIIGEEGESTGSSDAPAKEEAPAEEPAAEEEESASEESAPAASGDATDVEMPELGESVTEGTITQWLKSVGDTVEVDEPLLEVSTDKVDTEIPSPVAGTLVEILADEDDTIDVGAVIARIGDGNAKPAASEKKEEPKAEPKEEAPKEESPAEEPAADEEESASEESAPAASGDATDVEMPELGESVTEGTITQWLKSVGDTVEVDEPLLEVSTDKVDTEIPSPVAGTLVEILADEDDTIDVGAVIARIGDDNAKPAASAKKEEPKAEPKEEAPKEEAPAEEPAADEEEPKKEEPKEEAPKSEPKKEEAAPKASAKVNSGDNLPYVTPLVRKLADKHGIDLNTVEGTGVGGRIRKQDVLAAAEGGAESGSAAPAGERANWSTKSVDPAKQELIGTTAKVNRIREITASKMVESLHITAQLTHVQEVDMTTVAALRKKAKPAFVDKYGANLSFLPIIVKATVEALVSHPNVNASYNPETKEMTYHSDVNVAIAVDTPRGLLTPVIHKAQDLSLPEIAQAIADLADRARNNKLKPNDLTGATFTVTNIGSEGALLDTPVLVPPQAGILGTAVIEKRPVVITEDGQDAIAIRQMCYLPFTYDHQVVDGADAGRFITTIKDRLETGNFESDLAL